MRKEMVSVDPSKLVMVQLMGWASDNHYSNQLLGEMEYGAVVRAADNNPRALYANLADDRMMEAKTLSQASAVLVSCLAEILD